jgi:uncharacterized protein (TIGR00255 family)
MIKSMTGFGKAIIEFPQKTINIEVRSVNSKNFDFMTRIPPQFREKEPEMRKLAQSILMRGKIELSLTETQGNAGSSVEINPVAMKKHYKAIEKIATELGLDNKSDILSAILRIPDVLVTAQHELNPDEWELIKKGITQAFEALDHFRQVEGTALKIDFEKRIQNIANFSEKVTAFEEGRIQQLRNRFEKDLTNMIDQNRIDRNRLEQEIIYYLEKLDITEEKVRLHQHLDYFTTTLNEELSQGKKLNFISQEIGRELNTLGSKANNAQIQQLVVNMKDELEKIKEQMLNII